MKLTDLNPRWVGHGGEGVTSQGQPVPRREAVAIAFDCPCGSAECGRVCIELANPLDGRPPTRTDGHTWKREGETFETLSLTPSIQRLDNCRWHGFITNGEVRKC
jgi:hypothetical protein